MASWKHTLAGCIVILVLAGCSTASYQKQTSKLAEGMSAARDSFQTLSEEDRKSLISHETRASLNDGRMLETPRGECSAAKAGKPTFDCLPRTYDRKTGKAVPFVHTAVAPKGLKLSKVVATYGETLNELAAAKDIAEVKEAAGKVSSAIGNLAKAVEPAAPGAALATSVLSTANWLFGLYLDVRRLEELRSAVKRADPLIAEASNLLAKEAVKLQAGVIVSKGEELRDRRTAINVLRGRDPEQAHKMADSFVADALALDAYGKTDVTEPFFEMRKAHADLLKSLEQPDVNPEEALKRLQSFAEQMIALRDALKKGD